MSPKATLFQALIERITTQVPTIRFVDQDWGQLENYGTGKPPVSWPCALVDMAEFAYTEIGGVNRQSATGFVQIRLAQVQWSPSNSLAPTAIRQKAIEYYETEQALHEALQGWAPTGFSRMLRRTGQLEQRDDDIRVLVLRYYISYDDSTAQYKYTAVPRPDASIGIES